MSDWLPEQAERLYSVFAELVRRYQFRDRDQICCYGLSVSQCYTLEALAAGESITMGDLAERLCLKISSMTRVVDGLVKDGLVRRVEDPSDRRICRVQLAPKGRALLQKVQGGLLKEYEQVLAKVPADARVAVIEAMGYLLAAFQSRGCCAHDAEQLVPLRPPVRTPHGSRGPCGEEARGSDAPKVRDNSSRPKASSRSGEAETPVSARRN